MPKNVRAEHQAQKRVIHLFTQPVDGGCPGCRYLEEGSRREGDWAIEASVLTEGGQLIQALGESGQPSPAFLPSRARLH